MIHNITRKFLFAACGLLALAGLLTLLIWLFVDSKPLGSRIAQVASQVTGMEVKTNGPVKIRVFPSPGLNLEDLRIRNGKSEWLNASRLNLRVRLLPLLFGRIEVVGFDLVEPKLLLKRDVDGSFNFIPAHRLNDPNARKPFAIPHFRVQAATLTFLDQASGEQFTAESCDGTGQNLKWQPAQSQSEPGLPEFQGQLSCRKAIIHALEVTALHANVSAQGQRLEISTLTGQLLDGRLQAQLECDFSGSIPAHSLEAELAGFRIERFFKSFRPDQGAEGSATFSAQLKFSGKMNSEMMASLNGQAKLSAKELVLQGQNLDRQLARYDKTQRFNLVDIAALFVAGPAGLVITRGYGFATLFADTGEQTLIQELASEWDIANGLARARDVALATAENRLALIGELDFVNMQFKEMVVAVIDRNGCAIVEQRIQGKFHEPKIEQPHFLVSMVSPLTDIVKRGISLFTNNECEPFYTGRVKSP